MHGIQEGDTVVDDILEKTGEVLATGFKGQKLYVLWENEPRARWVDVDEVREDNIVSFDRKGE